MLGALQLTPGCYFIALAHVQYSLTAILSRTIPLVNAMEGITEGEGVEANVHSVSIAPEFKPPILETLLL